MDTPPLDRKDLNELLLIGRRIIRDADTQKRDLTRPEETAVQLIFDRVEYEMKAHR